MAWNKTKPANDELLSDTPALLRANWQALEDMTDAALLITNAKVAAAAGIVDTKLATISTAGKVSGAALTLLTSVPSGAGKLPLANIDSGTTANKVVVLDGSGYLPAVSGTNLTDIPCSAIASGTMAPARLGSGTAAATTYLTGAGAWGTVPSSSAVSVGTSLIAWSCLETQQSENSYAKAKEFLISVTGTVKTNFDLKNANNSSNTGGRIYVNGVAVGTDHTTTSSSYATKVDNIPVLAGDLLQLYAHDVSGYYGGFVRNFKVYADKYVSGTICTQASATGSYSYNAYEMPGPIKWTT